MENKFHFDAEAFKEKVSSMCKSGVVYLASASVLLGIIISCAISENNKSRFKNYEVVEAVATDDVVNEFSRDNKKVVLNSYLPVDINGDGKRDFDLQLVVDKKSKLSLKEFQLLQIKKDTKLVLEGAVERDFLDRTKSMKSFGNGVEVLEGRILIDNKRGASYMNADNIIAVDDEVVNMPRNNENVYKVVKIVNKNNMDKVLASWKNER